MTPKEKAIEIYDNFYLLHQSATDENGVLFISALNKGLAKKCALIAVDEIMKAIYNEDFDGHLRDEYDAATYWNEVKNEIEKL
jgi:hypothetical protein